MGKNCKEYDWKCLEKKLMKNVGKGRGEIKGKNEEK